MTTDYDAPRRSYADAAAGPAPETRDLAPGSSRTAAKDLDDGEMVESYDLPGADLSDEELSVQVVPQQQGEFVCMECFLVHHRTQLAEVSDDGEMICQDCAG